MPCRRLLQRRDPSISRGRATGAAAARGPTAPSTEYTAHGASKKVKAIANPIFYPSLPPKPHKHQPDHEFAQKPLLLPAQGLGAGPTHPRDPKSDILLPGIILAGADKTSLPLAAALRGGRAASVASLVANGCFLTLCVIRIYS